MTRHWCFILLLSASMTSFAARAEASDEDYVRLARLSLIEGHVSFQHAADVDWSAASVNMPLEPWDRIYTGPDGRAEIEFDDGSVYRLAENTDIEILTLREDLIQLRILVGISTLTASSGLDFEINTPAAAFYTSRKGVYRFNVGANGETEAIVRKGELEAASNEFSRRIESGEIFRVSPAGGDQGTLARYGTRDAWDEWNDRRNVDRRAYGSRSYIPNSVFIGVAELDRYGRWVDAGIYGYGWAPLFVDASWSPYSMGRWCYRPLFGWTWISYEPWGWLPYHYGRWHRHAHHGWCWLPGPGFSFNFWSPALVTFYSGPGWISWCPLGPGDYYNIHHYRYNRRIHGYQLDRLRALHSRPPGDPFNRHAPGAFRTAGIEHFRSGSFTGRNRRTPSLAHVDQPWKQGALVKDRLDIRPTSASFSAAPDKTVVRPLAPNNLPAVVRNSPQTGTANRERLHPITNPRVAAARPSALQSESGKVSPRETGAGDARRTDNRIIKVTGAEHTYRSERVSPANGNADRAVRSVRTPHASENRPDVGAAARGTWRAVPADRPANAAPSVRQAPSGTRNESAAPDRSPSARSRAVNAPVERSPVARPPSVSAPSALGRPQNTNRLQSNVSPPRSNSAGSWGNPGGGTAPNAFTGRSTVRSAPQPSFRSNGGAARTYSAPSRSAPRTSRSGVHAASPSMGRTGGGFSSSRPGGASAGRSRR